MLKFAWYYKRNLETIPKIYIKFGRVVTFSKYIFESFGLNIFVYLLYSTKPSCYDANYTWMYTLIRQWMDRLDKGNLTKYGNTYYYWIFASFRFEYIKESWTLLIISRSLVRRRVLQLFFFFIKSSSRNIFRESNVAAVFSKITLKPAHVRQYFLVSNSSCLYCSILSKSLFLILGRV